MRDQSALGAFYAYMMSRATTRAEARICAAGLAKSDGWFDDYVGPSAEFGHALRYALRAFDRGALWVVVRTTKAALGQERLFFRESAYRVLRAAKARGDARASQALGCDLLLCADDESQNEGFQILSGLAQVFAFGASACL